MTAAPKKVTLGKGIRLYVANSATPANDAAYTRVSNENSLEIAWKADEEKVETKEVDNKFSIMGATEITLKAELNEVFDDAGQALLPQPGKAALFQIRNENDPTNVKILVEGEFAVVDKTYKATVKGTTTWSYGLSAGGVITSTSRALITGA
uniref:Uncharacterized protein n=1 Tax=Caulobacter sp. (strain K31) TaxID=366602 RepID=B0T638_CAUSK